MPYRLYATLFRSGKYRFLENSRARSGPMQNRADTPENFLSKKQGRGRQKPYPCFSDTPALSQNAAPPFHGLFPAPLRCDSSSPPPVPTRSSIQQAGGSVRSCARGREMSAADVDEVHLSRLRNRPPVFPPPPCPPGKWAWICPPQRRTICQPSPPTRRIADCPTRYTARTQRTTPALANTPELLKYLLNIIRLCARSA